MPTKDLVYHCKHKCNLLDFLLKHHGSSPTKLKKLVKEKKIQVNDKTINKLDHSVEPNDLIRILHSFNKENNFDIIFENEHILAINKSANLLSVSDHKNKENLFAKLKKQYQEIFIVHRLDTLVTGVIIFAKTKAIQIYLEKNWSQYTKQYLAIVEGEVKKQSDILKNKLINIGPNIVEIAENNPKAKLAITEYSVENKNNKVSVLLINIKTGRKNQIRAQLANIGHPIIGDKKFHSSVMFQNYLFLHSWKLTLSLQDKKNICIEAPIPKIFNDLKLAMKVE